MIQPPRMPLAAVGMIAAHVYLELCKQNQMDRRQLGYTIPGTRCQTFGELYAANAAEDAWRIARAVEESAPTPKE